MITPEQLAFILLGVLFIGGTISIPFFALAIWILERRKVKCRHSPNSLGAK